jgi:nitrite reductase (NADH) small subunit
MIKDDTAVEAGWIEVGTVGEIPRMGARVVVTPRGNVAVFRTAGDQIFALDDRCPHKGGPLSQGIVHGVSVTCPLHNWVISLDTGEAAAPDEGCVRTLPVQRDGDRILLKLP